MTSLLAFRIVLSSFLAILLFLTAVTIAPAASLLENGSFETTGSGWLSPWYLQVKSGGGGTLSQTSATKFQGIYSATANVTSASASAPWLVQLSQSRLALSSGQTYTVSFAARAAAPRSLDVVLQKTASPYTLYTDHRFGLTANWQYYSFSYMPTASEGDATLHFNLAASTGSLWVDDVAIVSGAPGSPVVTPSPTLSPTPPPSPKPTPSPTPKPTPSPTPTPRPAGPGGKGVALRPFAQYWGSNLAGMRSDFADMRAGNITWARIDLYKTSQPDPAFDAAVQAAKDYGVNLVVTVHKTPPEKDLGTEADRAAYRSWLGQMVNRYKYHVKYWMIHNEPNLHYEWNIDDSSGSNQAQYVAAVNRYVSHLRDGFETVRANDPTAKVMFAGLSEWTVERYMDALTTTDAYRYFDIMAFHPYGRDPDRVMSRYNSFKAKMNRNPSFAAKPIWVTEIGFNTSWSNKAGYVTSEQTKASYLAQTLPRLQAAGAQLPIFWYTLHENEDVGGFALTRKNKSTLRTTYLPAFYAYRDLVFPQ